MNDKPRKRFPEPWYFVSNPINYINAADVRFANVTWPPIEQRTRNVIIGGYAIGSGNGDSWINSITQFRVESNAYLIGPGCSLALLFGETRLTGAPSGTGVIPEIPTVPGFNFWPGETFGLYGWERGVSGIPYRAPDRIDMRIVNRNGIAAGASDIQQIVLCMLELPYDAGAVNAAELEAVWDKFKRGIGALTFGTHQVDVPALGLFNFQDDLILTPWHNFQLRRTDMRGALITEAPAGTFNVRDDLYHLVNINTRSDRSRDQATAPVSAKLITGMGGLSHPGMAPLDYKSDGSDRDIIVVTAPAHADVSRFVEFATLLVGIEQREYYGRISGQAY